MSKKMLKRSLALGALMAFVITGQAWAGDDYDASEAYTTTSQCSETAGRLANFSANGEDVVVDINVVNGDVLTIENKSTTDEATRHYGLVANEKGKINVVGNIKFDVSGTEDVRVIRSSYLSKTADNNGGIIDIDGNVDITAVGGNEYTVGIDSWWSDEVNISGNVGIDATSSGRLIAIQNMGNDTYEKNSIVNIGGDLVVDATATQNYQNTYSDTLYAIYNNIATTTVEGDTNISIIDKSEEGLNALIVSADADTVNGNDRIDTVVNLKGNTTIDYENQGAGKSNVYGLSASCHDASINLGTVGKSTTTEINIIGNDVNDTAESIEVIGIGSGWNANVNSVANNVINIDISAKTTDDGRVVGIWAYDNDEPSGDGGNIKLLGANEIIATNNGSGKAYGVYGEAGGNIDLGNTTITATSKGGRAYGVWVDESTINLADTTITATSESSRACGVAAVTSSNIIVDGDITINTTAGERADGMNLEYSDIDVAGKLTVDATGETDDYQIGAQGVRLAYSTATFTDVDISAKSNTTGKVYGIRMLGDNGATNTQLAISGNAVVYAETNGVAYGIVVSTGADLGVEDDLSDTGKNLKVTVKGKEEASAIRAQYGSSINVSANTDVEIIATSENGNAYGVVNSYLTYDDANYAKANANISILGNVNIEANGKTGSYAVYNSTDYNKEEAENVGNTIIGGEGKLVTITGDMYANSGSITTTFGAKGSRFDGKVETVDSGTTTLNFAKGATWNLKGASTLTNATFDAGSTLVIEGKTFDTKEGSTDYALNGVGSDSKLTVKDGAKLTVTGIKETTYNIAKGFNTLEGTKVDETTTKYWDVNDVNTLMQGVLWNNGENGLQLEVYAKPADTLSEEMNVSESTAQSLASVTEAARVAEKEGAKPDVNGTGDDKAVAFINAMSGVDSKVAGQAFEAVSKMAEAGGNSATAASIVKNVTGVTNDRLSFNCGHSAPHKGGHGVGLFEEGSGADVWVEYVHGKDKVEDMPSTAGASSYEGQYNGIVMGVDFKKVNKFQSGIAFNYGEGDTNSVGSAARTHSDYDFWGIGYYGSIHNDDSNVIFDIGYAKTDSDVETNTIGINYKASPETTTWTAGVKLEKLYQNENVQIVPYTGLRFMSIDPDDYSTECASSKYDMERQNVWLLPLGVSIRQEIANDNGWIVSPKVDLSYIWAFGDTDSEMEFSTLGTKTNIGYEVMDDGSFLGLVGIEAHKGQWGFGVSYSYQKGDHSESKKWFIDANYSF